MLVPRASLKEVYLIDNNRDFELFISYFLRPMFLRSHPLDLVTPLRYPNAFCKHWAMPGQDSESLEGLPWLFSEVSSGIKCSSRFEIVLSRDGPPYYLVTDR